MANMTRMERYQELRDRILEENSQENNEVIEDQQTKENSVEDQLSTLLPSGNLYETKKTEEVIEEKNLFQDTISEVKTFEQIQRQVRPNVLRAINDAKASVGKEAFNNTRLDILQKIRNPEQVADFHVIDGFATAQFSKGVFLNSNLPQQNESKVEQNMSEFFHLEKEEEVLDQEVAPLVFDDLFTKDEQSVKSAEKVEVKPVSKSTKKVTLLDRLAMMSPQEDVNKVKKALQDKDNKESEDTQNSSGNHELFDIEKELNEFNNHEITPNIQENQKNDENSKIVSILNYIIVALVVVFVVLCVMIIAQIVL